ncbi:MAG: nuclear transport factor 2 family protein [Alphaproteobacteria bacterium]|nr:nuclear transport factor 2 family protein [Alphaproteobacteria bacterium]
MAQSQLAEIARQLVALCRIGKEAQALDTLYAGGAVSIEAMPMPGTASTEASGLEAIRAKHAWWNGAMDVHRASVEGPYLHGSDRFGVIFEIDATNKASGQRQSMKEIGLYTVADGKIVREEFFHGL